MGDCIFGVGRQYEYSGKAQVGIPKGATQLRHDFAGPLKGGDKKLRDHAIQP